MRSFIYILLGVALLCSVSACTQGSGNNNMPTATPEPKDPNQAIYDDAVSLARDKDVQAAINKLKTLPEEYEDSSALIEMFESALESSFVGTWYCSRANSCNDMEITLKITPYYSGNSMRLHYDRDMVSPTGSGGSKITGNTEIPSGNEVSASFVNGKFKLDGNNLLEIFPEMNRQNKYTKK